MSDELTILNEAFGPDESASSQARGRARAALLERVNGNGATARRARSVRWPIRVGLTAAVATAAAAGVVVVENLGTVDGQGTGRPAIGALPFAQPASAAEWLENAAWAAGRKAWTPPRPDQFMYKESRLLRNSTELLKQNPNGPLVPGQTRVVVQQEWKRIDAQVRGYVSDGQLVVVQQGGEAVWGQIPYADLAKLTTPEKVLAWKQAPKHFGVELDALLSQYVLPPDVEAAVFRALARREGMRMNPNVVNIDGRPAVGLGTVVEGYRSHELLFDKETFALIGERVVAIADHTGESLDGTQHFRTGDVFRQAVYVTSIIVDKVGDTK